MRGGCAIRDKRSINVWLISLTGPFSQDSVPFQTDGDDGTMTCLGRDHEGVRRGAALAQGLQDQAAAEGGTSGE